MHQFATRIFIGLTALFVVLFGMGAVAAAQSVDNALSQDKLDLISQRCSNSQFALQQIEKRDAVSRINRGRAYDQMIRQVSAMNSRFAYNKISSPDLLQLTSDLQSSIDKFRANYDRYDNDITEALKVDCKTKPADYYDLIIKARGDRDAVGDEVKNIDGLTAQYRAAISKYKDTVQ